MHFDGAVDLSATVVGYVDEGHVFGVMRNVRVNDNGGAHVHGAVNEDVSVDDAVKVNVNDSAPRHCQLRPCRVLANQPLHRASTIAVLHAVFDVPDARLEPDGAK